MPVSVVVPTIGRLDCLEDCLRSLSVCRPRAAEIIVVDQSRDTSARDAVTRFDDAGARVVPCEGRGVSRGRNLGLESARNEIVLITDDDCTVSRSWVARAWELMSSDADRIVSGRVLPADDARQVPSTKDDPCPRQYHGKVRLDALFPNNMAMDRRAVLAFGGFDERFTAADAAEDVEFCYRWLRSGRRITYDPELVVWHADWRTQEELALVRAAYWRGAGVFHAKYLRRRDPDVTRFILSAMWDVARGLVRDWHGFRRGYMDGMTAGWRLFEDERRLALRERRSAIDDR